MTVLPNSGNDMKLAQTRYTRVGAKINGLNEIQLHKYSKGNKVRYF